MSYRNDKVRTYIVLWLRYVVVFYMVHQFGNTCTNQRHFESGLNSFILVRVCADQHYVICSVSVISNSFTTLELSRSGNVMVELGQRTK